MAGAFENAAFQLTGYQTDAETISPPGGIGHHRTGRLDGTRPRRIKVYVDDRPLRLTPDEIESLIKRTLDAPAEPPSARDVAELPASEQAYAVAYPAYVSLRAQFLARENELALAKLREVAMRLWLLEDERDVEMLLRDA